VSAEWGDRGDFRDPLGREGHLGEARTTRLATFPQETDMFRKARLLLLVLPLLAGFLGCSDAVEPDVSAGGDGGVVPVEPPDANANDGSPGPGTDAGSDAAVPPDAGPSAVGKVVAYAFSGDAQAAESVPPSEFSYSASGGDITVARTGTGQYSVTFAGLALDSSVALVSAFATPGGLCYWMSTTGDTVRVRCTRPDGVGADGRFVITVFDRTAGEGASVLGYADANDMSSASYTPDPTRSNNAVGGGGITATRVAVGTYAMTFEGIALSDIGNVQVKPYGSEGTKCVVHSWGGATVGVRCYTGLQVLADAPYSVMIVGKKPGATAKVVAFAHAADETEASYSPTLGYDAAGGAITATRSAAGTYTTEFAGRNLNGSHVQVTSQGKPRRCNVGASMDTSVTLTCANPGNLTKTDSNYAIVVLQ
jgi:hypothetical protein